MGRIFGSWGVRGGIRVDPYSEDPETLAGYKTWLVGCDGKWHEYSVTEARLHTTQIVAQLAGVDGRDAALKLKGCDVAVPRGSLPRPDDGSYYWVDLIGLKVVNSGDEGLGVVKEVFNNGAQDVIDVVEPGEPSEPGTQVRRLIPWTAVLDVDLQAKIISVEWQRDW